MSVELMALAWRQPLPTAPKIVLLAMCDHADPDGGSVYPSMKHVANKASLSKRQTQRVVHMLIEQGWLRVVGNERGGARGASRRYEINVAKLKDDKLTSVTPKSSSDDIQDNQRVAAEAPADDTGVTQTIIEAPEEEPSDRHQSRQQVLPYDFFEMFWEIFPPQRKGSKDKALEAWKKAVKKESPAVIYEAAERYAHSRDVKNGYAKGCAAWLNDERWTDRHDIVVREKKSYGDIVEDSTRYVLERIKNKRNGGIPEGQQDCWLGD